MSNFNSFKFTSETATPKESRNGSRSGERSRSPNRFTSSSLNDSRRPGVARSPSNSSPHHLSNRPTTTRTNSTDQPIRNPEVGIRILGIAAQADKERKQREEEARRYNNNRLAAQNNAKATSKSDVPMAPAVARSGALVEQPSEKGKEKALEVPSSEQGNDSSLTLKLAEALRTMVNELSEVSSLKTRRNNAKVKLTKAQAEFEKTKSYHLGFPSIKETQSQAKKAAEQDFKKANEQLDAKDASLDQLALRVAEQIIPSIVGASTANQQQKEMQDRITSLENMCRNYHALVEGHKRFLESQKEAKAISENWEQKLTAVTEDVRSLKPRQEKLMSRQNDFENLHKSDSSRLDKLSNTVSAIPPDLVTQQLRKFQELEKLQSKVEALDTTSQANLAQLKSTVVDLNTSVSLLHKTYMEGSTTSQALAEEQAKLRGEVIVVSERITKVESNQQQTELAKQNVSADSATKHTSDLATAKQLELLEGKLETSDSKSSALEGRFIQLQATVEELRTHTTRLEKKLDQSNTLEAGQKKITADVNGLKARLALLESQRQAAPDLSVENLNTSNGNGDLHISLASEVARLKADLESQRSDFDGLVDMTGDTIKDIVEANIAQLTPRLDAMEVTTSDMGNSLMQVESQVKDHGLAILDAKNSLVGAAAHSAIEIIKSQNLFAPAGLDEKFTNDLGTVKKTILDHIEAHSLAIGGVQHRMDNLTTGDVHAAIIHTLNSTYPTLRKSEFIFKDHASKLATLDRNMGALHKLVEEQLKQATAPVAAPPVPAPKADDEEVKRMRSELDGLTQDVAKLQRLDEQFESDLEAHKEQTSTDLAEIKRETVTLSEEVATNIFELKSSIGATDRNVTSLGGKVREIETRVEGISLRQRDIEKRVETASSKQQRAPSHTPSANTMMSRNAFKTSSTILPPIKKLDIRETSIASDASGSSKASLKRGRSDTAGSNIKAPSGNGPVSPRKLNGLKNKGRFSGSPNPKRLKRGRTKNEDDSDQDSDFDGETNQGISADEDEDLPPRPIKTKQEDRGGAVIDLCSD